MPHVMTLLLAHGVGRVFAVFDNGPEEKTLVPPKVIDYGGRRTSAAEIRSCVPEQLGNNIVVVKFHAAWILTALFLALPACRVVNPSAKEAY